VPAPQRRDLRWRPSKRSSFARRGAVARPVRSTTKSLRSLQHCHHSLLAAPREHFAARACHPAATVEDLDPFRS
jgi:hypothetical protein